MTAAGVYIHWPFCERKCPYCDFYTFGREHPAFQNRIAYLQTLINEILSAPERLTFCDRPAVDSIYLGGGTPSLMGPEAAERILATLQNVFAIQPDVEITLEVNPTTAETARIGDLIALGVNRFSVGVQSFNDEQLKALGRVHDTATTRRAIEAIRAAGADNLSLDLIFGAPGQSEAAFEADLAEMIRQAPEHLSAYGLTVHEGTPLARWQAEGRVDLPGEESQAAMFERLMDALAEAGYLHYEISNWSRPGRVSRHNSKYWHACDVYGFGVAAHGVVGGRRLENPRDLTAYLQGKPEALAQPADPPADERSRTGEIMMLALRRVEGVEWAEVDHWAGCNLQARYAQPWTELTADGLVWSTGERFGLTRRGILLADWVMEKFF